MSYVVDVAVFTIIQQCLLNSLYYRPDILHSEKQSLREWSALSLVVILYAVYQ